MCVRIAVVMRAPAMQLGRRHASLVDGGTVSRMRDLARVAGLVLADDARARRARTRSACFICDFMLRPSKRAVGADAVRRRSSAVMSRAAATRRRRRRTRRRARAASGTRLRRRHARRMRSMPMPKPMPGVAGPPSSWRAGRSGRRRRSSLCGVDLSSTGTRTSSRV